MNRCKVYTLAYEIPNSVDTVMGIKNVYEIEGVFSTRDSSLHFLNRSTPFFPKTEILLRHREQRFIKVNVPFKDEISGLVMIKLLDPKTGCTNIMKAKFIRNTGFLDVTHNSTEPLIIRLSSS